MLTVLRLCSAGCKLHEMLQMLVRTASWHTREVAQFLHEIVHLARCLNFFSACSGPCMAPFGAAEFLWGWTREKGSSFVDKSAKDAPGQTSPATLGLGPLH